MSVATTEDTKIRHPHVCNGCALRWAGANTAHCSSCHRTFSGITTFDQHRRGGSCTDPAGVGLELSSRSYECWANPADPDRPNPFADGLFTTSS